MCTWVCVCQRRSSRRTQFQHHGLHTLLLHWCERGGYIDRFTVVPNWVTLFWLVFVIHHTPGLVRVSDLFISTDAVIGHPYNYPSPSPLPGAASSQRLLAQDLMSAVAKSVWTLRIRLQLLHVCRLPVPLRQKDVSARCVYVQCEITGICSFLHGLGCYESCCVSGDVAVWYIESLWTHTRIHIYLQVDVAIAQTRLIHTHTHAHITFPRKTQKYTQNLHSKPAKLQLEISLWAVIWHINVYFV